MGYGYNRSFTVLPSGQSQICKLSQLTSPAKSIPLNEIINNDAKFDSDPTETDDCVSFGNTDFKAGNYGYGTNGSIDGGYCIADTGYMGTPSIATAPASLNPTGWHTDCSNFLLADGHTKWMRGAAVSPGINAQNLGDAQGAHTTSYYGNNYSTAAATDISTFAATFSLN